jgi:hypothetical protein
MGCGKYKATKRKTIKTNKNHQNEKIKIYE